jgi:hypothetical protein
MDEDDIPLTSLPSKRKHADDDDGDAVTPPVKRVTRSGTAGSTGAKSSSRGGGRRGFRGSAFVARPATRRGGRGRQGKLAMSRLFDSTSEEDDEEEEEEEVKDTSTALLGDSADEDDEDDNGDAADNSKDEGPVRMFDLEAIREYVTCHLCSKFFQDCHSISECLHSCRFFDFAKLCVDRFQSAENVFLNTSDMRFLKREL